ncbi:MAG TPA: LPS assembly protein LptD [Candidatus Binatia bacterium]|jgi:LPS-assembly protein|nr:LPS assembly protein LptD [Candidatus Binatia bacterium]
MKMRSRLIHLSAGLILFLCQAAPVFGQAGRVSAGGEEKEIRVTADSLTVGDSGNQVEAKGNVEIRHQETILQADEVRVNRTTQEVEAKGKVSVDDPEWKLKSAESVQLNLEKETGEIQKGDIFIENGHLSITGSRFQKLTGQTYHIDEGFFTTCLCESGRSPWRISGDQIDLRREGEGVIRHGWFYILDVPVLYIPYAVFPLRSERQTGFLFPGFGSSTKEGFRFDQPFFWAISKSTDATFRFDLETRARLGFQAEARTIFKQEAPAQLNVSYFNEKWRKNAEDDIVDRTIADQDIPKDRWNLTGFHRYTAASNWQTFTDIAVFSDDLFTRELVNRFDLAPSREIDLRTSRYGRSRLGFLKGWRDTYFRGQWDFYQDFIQDDKTTLHRTPQISFWGRRFFQALPLELRWRGEGVNYLRREGGDGLRLDLRPEMVLPFRISNYLFGSFNMAPRETAYHLYQTQASSDRNLSREVIELRGNVGTSIGRVFDWRGTRLQRIKHSIEPELTYLFIPDVRQDTIPVMDSIDRIRRRNVLTFSLVNRFLGRFEQRTLAGTSVEDKDVELLSPSSFGDVQELTQLRLALSYDIDKERKGGDSLSDLDFNLRFTPAPYLSVGFDGGLDPGPWHLTQSIVTLGLSDPRPITRRVLDRDFMRPSSISLSYNFIRKGLPNAFLAEDANIDLSLPADCPVHPLDPRCPGTAFDRDVVGALGGSLFYRVTDHLLFYMSSSYDTRDSSFPGYRVATKILSQCECWTLTLSLGRTINPAKTSFNFNFDLLGLGSQRSSLR